MSDAAAAKKPEDARKGPGKDIAGDGAGKESAAKAAKAVEAAKGDEAAKASEPAPAARMPGAGDFDFGPAAGEKGEPSTSAPASVSAEERERNTVFGNLVTGDDDIVGLVAYSIYKQNKHDWLVAFNKAKGREPNEAEASSYILGEATQRRLSIYRHLARATLEGQGPHVTAGKSGDSFIPRSFASTGRGGGHSAGAMAMWVIGIGAVVVALYLAAKYGLPGIQR